MYISWEENLNRLFLTIFRSACGDSLTSGILPKLLYKGSLFESGSLDYWVWGVEFYFKSLPRWIIYWVLLSPGVISTFLRKGTCCDFCFYNSNQFWERGLSFLNLISKEVWMLANWFKFSLLSSVIGGGDLSSSEWMFRRRMSSLTVCVSGGFNSLQGYLES